MNSVSSSHRSRPSSGFQRQYKSLQAGRGFAALLVVFHHAGLTVGHDPRLWNDVPIYRWLMGPKLGVAFFFVLSGMVILLAHRRDLGCPASIQGYSWRRFRRIYPIYWLVLGITICGQFISKRPEAVQLRNPFVIASGILLVHIRFWETNNLLVAWTLFHEVMFYSLFGLAILNKRLGGALLTVWFVASLFNLHSAILPEDLCSPFHLLFAMGMAAAWLVRFRKPPLPVFFFSLGSLIFIGTILYSSSKGEATVLAFLAAGVGASLALLSAATIEGMRRIMIPRFVLFLGEASYSIYLVHFPIVKAFGRLCFKLDGYLHWPTLLWLCILVCVGTGVGCVFHLFVERPLLGCLGIKDRRMTSDVAPQLNVLPVDA
jgi:exopolysaccharide production protein ExoZ